MVTEKKQVRFSIIWAIIYLVLMIGLIVSACFLFKSKYYTQIFVSGNSMNPTLIGNTNNRVDYGLADTSTQAINKIKRFDIVVTTYPSTWSSDVEGWKIKRVWGLPGEKIELSEKSVVIESVTKYYVNFSVFNSDNSLKYSINSNQYEHIVNDKHTIDIKFKTDIKEFSTISTIVSPTENSVRKFALHELHDDEYFVMGDNWKTSGSSDSYSHLTSSKEYLAKSNLCGNVICMEGTGKVKTEGTQKVLYDKQPYQTRYFF